MFRTQVSGGEGEKEGREGRRTIFTAVDEGETGVRELEPAPLVDLGDVRRIGDAWLKRRRMSGELRVKREEEVELRFSFPRGKAILQNWEVYSWVRSAETSEGWPSGGAVMK